jgi:hypothetical protein
MSKEIKAIQLIRPGAEFVIIDNDLENITWHILDGEVPTKKEILDAVKTVEANELKDAQDAETAKAAILQRLGITADEAKLLLT